jgi:hypothetical protein
MLRRGNRVFNIDPPTSPNAIMRRAKPLPRREQWIGQAHQGELDTNPRVREQPQPKADSGLVDGSEALVAIHMGNPGYDVVSSGGRVTFGGTQDIGR